MRGRERSLAVLPGTGEGFLIAHFDIVLAVEYRSENKGGLYFRVFRCVRGLYLLP